MPAGESFRHGHVREMLAAVMQEDLAALHRDLLQRLQAVGDEAGIDDRDPLHALAGEPLDRLVGIGLQPFLRPEARLEGRDQPPLAPAEPLAQKPRRLLAMAVIGVALLEIGLRQAVIGGDHDLRLEVERREMRSRSLSASASI